MQHSSRHWTQTDIERLRVLATRHVRLRTIARELGRPAGSVRLRASLEGISLSAVGHDVLARWWPKAEAFRAARGSQAGGGTPA